VLFAFLTAMSVVVSGVASTLALGRAQVGVLDADLASKIDADYSADPTGTRLAPLDAEIGEAVRQDELRLEDKNDDVEIVDVFYVDPPENTADEGDPESGTETPGGSPTPGPEAGSSAVPGITPAPRSTPTPTPTPKSAPDSTPPRTPAPTAAPTPAPTAAPKPTPTCSAPDPLSGFVESITPSDGARGVSVSTNVVIKFNQPMDATTIITNNVSLPGPVGSAGVDVTLSYNATTYEVTLNPDVDLDPGAEYHPAVWKQIKNACGTKQGVEAATMFTTVP
jgi:hypothetical protein